jgi:hypothetical protein
LKENFRQETVSGVKVREGRSQNNDSGKGERVKVKGQRDGSSIEEGIKGSHALLIRSKVL